MHVTSKLFDPFYRSVLQNKKRVYFVPNGGITDILCQLHKILHEFCIKNNRILMIDMNASCYKIRTNDYFTFDDKHIISKFEDIYGYLIQTNLTIYPPDLKHEYIIGLVTGTLISDFKQLCSNSSYCQILKHSNFKTILRNGNPIELGSLPDATDDDGHDKDCIVVSRCGFTNAESAYKMFKKMKFLPNVKDTCQTRYNEMKTTDGNMKYIGIHIRNTDLKCDWEDLIQTNYEKINAYDNIYVATDDVHVVHKLKSMFGNKIKNFTTYPSKKERDINLHKSNISGDIKIMDLMTDICLIALAEELLSNSKGGFIQFLRMCHGNKEEIKIQMLRHEYKYKGLCEQKHILNTVFDTIVCICMPERKLPMIKLFSDSNVNINIYDAYDKQYIDTDKLIAEKFISPQCTLKPGEICCAYSHKNVLVDFLKTSFKTILIFEDDVLSVDETDKLRLILSKMPNEWEYINFGSCWDNCSLRTKIPETNYFLKSQNALCINAVAFSRNGVQKILSNLPLLEKEPLDIVYKHIIQQHELKAYTTYEQIFKQNRQEFRSYLDNYDSLRECM